MFFRNCRVAFFILLTHIRRLQVNWQLSIRSVPKP
jgi:hypothetical protein